MLPPASSTFPEVPEYCLGSTGVLSREYWSTDREVLKTIKVKNYRKLGK
jgi:hypothetical protein